MPPVSPDPVPHVSCFHFMHTTLTASRSGSRLLQSCWGPHFRGLDKMIWHHPGHRTAANVVLLKLKLQHPPLIHTEDSTTDTLPMGVCVHQARVCFEKGSKSLLVHRWASLTPELGGRGLWQPPGLTIFWHWASPSLRPALLGM